MVRFHFSLFQLRMFPLIKDLNQTNLNYSLSNQFSGLTYSPWCRSSLRHWVPGRRPGRPSHCRTSTSSSSYQHFGRNSREWRSRPELVFFMTVVFAQCPKYVNITWSYIVGDVFHPLYDLRVILLPHLHTVLYQLELPSASTDGEASVAPNLKIMS